MPPLPGQARLNNTVGMTRPSTDVVLRGRPDELRSVAHLLRAATEGHGGALVFTGDGGTGKSAMLAAAMGQASGTFTVVEACGWQSETELRYAGLHRLLEASAGLPGGLPAEGARALARTLANPTA